MDANMEQFKGMLWLLSSGYIFYDDKSSPYIVLPKIELNLGSDPYAEGAKVINTDKAQPATISPQHCVIFFDDVEQQFFIQDTFSEYGTWVNGNQLAPEEVCLLNDKDDIELGDPHHGGATLKFFFQVYNDDDNETLHKMEINFSVQ